MFALPLRDGREAIAKAQCAAGGPGHPRRHAEPIRLGGLDHFGVNVGVDADREFDGGIAPRHRQTMLPKYYRFKDTGLVGLVRTRNAAHGTTAHMAIHAMPNASVPSPGTTASLTAPWATKCNSAGAQMVRPPSS